MTDVAPRSQRDKTLAMALALANHEYKVFPCLANRKTPATRNGFKDATTDPGIVERWFANHDYNLAIACGQQLNGTNLFAVDIDPRKGGFDTWAALTTVHGDPLAPRHMTPSGGFHVFFDAPTGLRNSAARLGPGIDTRGEGGYVVVPPSRLVDEHGEYIVYDTTKATALVLNRPPGLPLWIIEALEPGTPSPDLLAAIDRHPSSAEPSIFDWVKDHWPILDLMLADGWEIARTTGDQVFVTRPGKHTREGHSAVIHVADNFAVVWSTNAPPALTEPLRRRQVNQDGSISWSVADYYVATRHGGDYASAARAAMRAAGWEAPERAATEAPVGDNTPPPPVDLGLPAEFYDQRPWMAACRQKAQAVGGSPAAHLLAYLCRWAALIPPSYTIPAINGAPSALNLYGVLVGTSGAGKSSPMRNAGDMLPVLREDVRMDLGMGSGEGLIEAFYANEEVVYEDPDDGKMKRTKVRRKCIQGVHFAVDEGSLLAELGERSGATHVSRLLSAWTGGALSTANAKQDTFRHIDAGQYALSMLLGIQVNMAHLLMTEGLASLGFVGRLLFVWTEEPRVSPRPAHPVDPVIPLPAGVSVPATKESPKRWVPVELTYPDDVVLEVQRAADQRVGTDVPVEEHHHDLLRLKLAGILALMDGRTFVDAADWRISSELVEHSKVVRTTLYETRRRRVADARHIANVARAEGELVVEDLKERRYIASMAENLRAKVKDEPMSRGKLERRVSSAKTRHRFDKALALAVSNGWIVIDGDQVRYMG